MMAQAQEYGIRQNPRNIKLVGASDESMPFTPEVAVAEGDDAQILRLDRMRPEPRPISSSSGQADDDAGRLESVETPEQQPIPPTRPPRQERLAERLDHAMDEIRRLMHSDRGRGSNRS